MLVLYAVVPVPGESGPGAFIELVVGLAIFLAILGWQVHSIVAAEHPELRAIEALALAVTGLIIVFAYTYLSLDQADQAGFTQPLDRVGAFYFTAIVLGTVGFGDIAAKSDAARILVTIQIVLDLVVLAGIARTLLFAARVGVRDRQQQSAHSDRTD